MVGRFPMAIVTGFRDLSGSAECWVANLEEEVNNVLRGQEVFWAIGNKVTVSIFCGGVRHRRRWLRFSGYKFLPELCGLTLI